MQKHLRKEKVIYMMKDKMLVIEDFNNKKNEKFFRTDEIKKAEIKRRNQIETTKILYFKHETKQ